MALPRPDPERDRRVVGAVLFGLFMLAGAAALVVLFLLTPLASRDPAAQYRAMGVGALCALPPLAVYLWIPRLIDRFDPEPWWALALVLGWGAIAACGVAATVNTGSRRSDGDRAARPRRGARRLRLGAHRRGGHEGPRGLRRLLLPAAGVRRRGRRRHLRDVRGPGLRRRSRTSSTTATPSRPTRAATRSRPRSSCEGCSRRGGTRSTRR